jgi:hypothetical protein
MSFAANNSEHSQSPDFPNTPSIKLKTFKRTNQPRVNLPNNQHVVSLKSSDGIINNKNNISSGLLKVPNIVVTTSAASAQSDVSALSINRSLGYRISENSSNRSHFDSPTPF